MRELSSRHISGAYDPERFIRYFAAMKKSFFSVIDYASLPVLASSILVTVLSCFSGLFGNTPAGRILLYVSYLAVLTVPAAVSRLATGDLPGYRKSSSAGGQCPLAVAFFGVTTLAAYLNRMVTILLEKAGLISGTAVGPEIRDLSDMVLAVLTLCIIVPLAEEMLFRNYVLRRCLPMGTGKAVMLSSLLFAMLHADVSQLIYAFAGGTVLACVTLMSGSVIPTVVLHSANNLAAVLISAADAFLDESTAFAVSAVFDLVTVLAAAAAFVFILVRKKRCPEYCTLPEYREDQQFPCDGSCTVRFPVVTVIFAVYTASRIAAANFSL